MSIAEGVRPAPLLYEVRESGVAILTFNRPERMNSWGGPMIAEFYRHIDLAEADPRVRVIVITGEREVMEIVRRNTTSAREWARLKKKAGL